MILLLAIARAEDMAFSCPVLTTPADGVGFRDVGSLGSGFLDQVLVLAEAYYDSTCPADATADTYADACFTAAGDAIAVYHEASDTRIWWSLTVVPAAGSLTSLDLAWGWDVDSSSLVRRDELTVAWTGTLAEGWPGDGDVRWTRALEAEGSAELTRAETWEDGTCTWAATRRASPWREEAPDDWEIGDGSQELIVHEEQSVACAIPDVYAELDGTTWEVVPRTWEAPDRYTGAVDHACDGIDQDCSGFDRMDCDRDGHEDIAVGGDDCDGVDGDDYDADGYFDCDDCDDMAPEVNPAATEIPGNGVDENCVETDDGDAVEDTDSDSGAGAPDNGSEEPEQHDTAPTNLAPAACAGCATPGPPSLLFLLLGLRRRR